GATAGTYSFSSTAGWVEFRFDSCLAPIGLDVSVSCQPANLYVGALTAPGADGGLANVVCEIYVSLLGCSALLVGSVDAGYVNPVGPLSGRLVIPSLAQNLSVLNSQCSSIIPNGSATLSGGAGSLDYELDPAATPHPEIH